VRRAIEPLGESRPDWEILSALSVLMGAPLEYGDAKEITNEIRSLIPGHGLLGAGPTPPKPDDATVTKYLTEGFRADLSARYALSKTDWPAGEFTLVSQQSLFHSGKFSTRSKGLLQIQSTGSLALNSTDAARMGLADGGRVRLSNQQGEMTTTVKTQDRVPEGMAVFPEHFDQELRHLTGMAVDPQTGVPYCKTVRVRIAKA